jgi:hypothetical protein
MGDYRLYCLDTNGKISDSGEVIQASSDDEALAIARSKKLAVHCELWLGNRLVGPVPAHRVA